MNVKTSDNFERRAVALNHMSSKVCYQARILLRDSNKPENFTRENEKAPNQYHNTGLKQLFVACMYNVIWSFEIQCVFAELKANGD